MEDLSTNRDGLDLLPYQQIYILSVLLLVIVKMKKESKGLLIVLLILIIQTIANSFLSFVMDWFKDQVCQILGIIIHIGNDQSTPDIVIGMMDLEHDVQPEPMSYLAIADGLRQHNMAKVYAGTYRYFLIPSS
jgi:hypothetical protein